MIPENGESTHPGEVLREEFLEPLAISQSALAEHVGIPVQRVNEICQGRRGISPDTAWLFAAALGTTAEFWMNLQSTYELTTHRLTRRIRPIAKAG